MAETSKLDNPFSSTEVATPSPPSSSDDNQKSADTATGGCSLLLILVVTCTAFVAITSVVSFYVQYNFFVTEYHNQMTSRLQFYNQMSRNHLSVMADSNSTIVSQLISTAQFDAVDGMMTMNPMDSKEYQWYVQMANAMFFSETPVSNPVVVDFVFLATGNKLSVQVRDYKVTITSNVGSGMFMMMPWMLNETLTPWFPLAAPVFVGDPRAEGDNPTIIANPGVLDVPRLGTLKNNIIPLHGLAKEALSGTPAFIVSAQIETKDLRHWTNVLPDGDSYIFNDNQSIVFTTHVFNENTTIMNVDKYVRHLAQERRLSALLADNLTTPIAKIETANGGFTWGMSAVPLNTLTGLPWKLLIIDRTTSYLSTTEPIYSGVGVIVGVVVGACLICIFLFRWWFVPLDELTERVKNAEKGYRNAPMSFTPFSEIQQSQDAFLTVQQHLREIQSYVPQTLQRSAVRKEKPVRPTATRRPTSAERPEEPIEPVLVDQAVSAPTRVEADDNSHTPCPMTALHIKIHAYARWDSISPFLEMFATVLCRYQGVLDTVDYGTITATFHCHSQCPSHSLNAIKAAIEIEQRARTLAARHEGLEAPPFTIAVDTDAAMAVTVSFDDVKARVVLGDGFELVRKLTSLAFDVLKAPIVVTDSVIQAVPDSFRLPIDYIQPATAGASGRPRVIYELLETPFGWPDPAMGASLEAGYLRAFEILQSGNYGEARVEFERLVQATEGINNCPLRKQASRLMGVCEDHQQRAVSGPYLRVERCPWDVLPAERLIVSMPRNVPVPQPAPAGGRPAQPRGRR